jgi:hypothetical protein
MSGRWFGASGAGDFERSSPQITLGPIRRGPSGERQVGPGGRGLQNLFVQPITALLLSQSQIFVSRGRLRHRVSVLQRTWRWRA